MELSYTPYYIHLPQLELPETLSPKVVHELQKRITLWYRKSALAQVFAVFTAPVL